MHATHRASSAAAPTSRLSYRIRSASQHPQVAHSVHATSQYVGACATCSIDIRVCVCLLSSRSPRMRRTSLLTATSLWCLFRAYTHMSTCSAIRRRCMEKNWKKLISRRHVRESESSTTVAISSSPPPTCDIAPTSNNVQSINAPLADTTLLDALLPSSDTASYNSLVVPTAADTNSAVLKTEDAIAESPTVTRAKQQLAVRLAVVACFVVRTTSS